MNNAITILDHLHFATPTTEQKNALTGMADFSKKENTDDFMILCGAAGTGKTSIVSAFINYLNQMNVSYQIAAPTGRAARIIGRKSNAVSSTLHSMIYTVVPNKKTGTVSWQLKQNHCAKETIYIIDEASMIPSRPGGGNSLFKSNNSLLADLVAYVKNGNKSNKVLLLGDRYQLPPINETQSNALCSQYLTTTFGWKGKSNMLTEVKRQVEGSVIMMNAVNTRKGIDKNHAKVEIKAPRCSSLSHAAKQYVDDFTTHGEVHAISIGSTHNMNIYFNSAVREKLFGKEALKIECGDLMMVTSNWNRGTNRLFNGDHVMVKDFFPEQMEEIAGLHFMPIKVVNKTLAGAEEEIDDYLLVESLTAPNGQLGEAKENNLRTERFKTNRNFSESGLPEHDRYVGALRLNYGYSITCNKAQGGEWEKVYFNTFFVPNLKFQYTAITRAKTNLVLY